MADEFAGHTVGPWRWQIDRTNRSAKIVGGKPRFDLTLLDFVRWGANSAAPRFREDVDGMNIMHRADEHAIAVAGREHHAEWFADLNHPDARLIAAAPTLLAERNQRQAERDELLAALRELVAVEDLKHAAAKIARRFEMEISDADLTAYDNAISEVAKRKPIAWKTARTLISRIESDGREPK